jgi:hypothetical protein
MSNAQNRIVKVRATEKMNKKIRKGAGGGGNGENPKSKQESM